MENEYGENIACCSLCNYYIEPPNGSAFCLLLQKSTTGDERGCKFAQKIEPLGGCCKKPGEETRFTYDQFQDGKCISCDNQHVCWFTMYKQGFQYGPFNCAGESISMPGQGSENQTELIIYRYYSTQRPVDIGTFPKTAGGPIKIENYNNRIRIAPWNFFAWGFLEYNAPLDAQDAANYELKPAPSNPNVDSELRIALPGGYSLLAQAISEEDYPGIWISLVKPDGSTDWLCFAEHNPNKPEGHELHIGAYTATDDEPSYYESYFRGCVQ